MNHTLRNGFIGVFSLVVVALSVGAASAYDVIEVPHGGKIEGTVELKGAIPEPKGFNLITFPDPAYCGRISNGRGWRLLHDFVVGPQAGTERRDCILGGRRGWKTIRAIRPPDRSAGLPSSPPS